MVKLLNECAEKSGSPERLLMCDLPMKHMAWTMSFLCCVKTRGGESSSEKFVKHHIHAKKSIFLVI